MEPLQYILTDILLFPLRKVGCILYQEKPTSWTLRTPPLNALSIAYGPTLDDLLEAVNEGPVTDGVYWHAVLDGGGSLVTFERVHPNTP